MRGRRRVHFSDVDVVTIEMFFFGCLYRTPSLSLVFSKACMRTRWDEAARAALDSLAPRDGSKVKAGEIDDLHRNVHDTVALGYRK